MVVIEKYVIIYFVERIFFVKKVNNIIYNNYLFIEFENASNENIFKEIMKIEQEMTNKYSYDNWDKFKCDDNENYLNLEKKFDIFSIDKGYNYACNMSLNKKELPDINLDLSKIIEYYKKSENNSTDDLIKEIASFNDYFKSITKNVNMQKVES